MKYFHKKSHLQKSLDFITFAPFSSIFTILVIAIALSLPLGLHLIAKNAKSFSGVFLSSHTDITAYLKSSIQDERVETLLEKLRSKSNISSVRYIVADEGIKLVKKNLAISNVLAGLKENPLPDVLVIRPNSSVNSFDDIEALVAELKAVPEISMVQLDEAWLSNFFDLNDFINENLYILIIALSIAMSLVIVNSVRLAVMPLHSDAIYVGLCYGLLGSLFAWAIVTIVLFLLRDQVQNLLLSYGSVFQLQGLNMQELGVLFGAGAILGLLGTNFVRH